MLKIYELILKQPFRGFIIEEIINEAKVGRSSGFAAISWMESAGLINIKEVGKQKSVQLIINDAALNFKFFLDSLKIRKLPRDVSFPIYLFLFLTMRSGYAHKKIDLMLLFGSSLSSKSPGDIDIEIIYSEDEEDSQENIEHLKAILKSQRKLIENISEYTINFHLTPAPDYLELLERTVVYNRNYYSELFLQRDKLFGLKCKYYEALEVINSILNNLNDNALFDELTRRLIINLAYCYCMTEEIKAGTKDDVKSLFMEKYKNEMSKLNSLNNIEKLNVFKKISNEIGQKIFR